MGSRTAILVLGEDAYPIVRNHFTDMKPFPRLRSDEKPLDYSGLKILLLEDDPIDVELIQTALSSGGVQAELICTHKRQDFLEILQTQPPDLILSDYILPKFDGFSALKIACEVRPEVPFIMVSGVLGEEQAIEALKQGATDYVLKHRLERLVPAAVRALQESRERRKRQQLEASLHQTDDLLKAIVEASPIAIFTLNLDGRVMTWNVMAEQIYGWQAKEVLDRPLPVIPDNSLSAFQQHFHQVLHSRTLTNLECQHLKKDGSLVEISASLLPVHNLQSEVHGVVITAIERTASKPTRSDRLDQLWCEQKARTALESASRIKDEFLGMISHELRTPLNAIVGWVKLIQKNNLNPVVLKQAVEVIERNATLQTQLIEDLLDMSHILRGNLRLTLGCVDMVNTIRAALDALEPAIAAKSIQVKWVMNSPVTKVSGDPVRLQQVLWNLLSNAIKFTPAGGQITVQLDQQGTHIRVQVIDTGIGIEADFLPYVFEYFRQADASTTRFYNGLGLGLAISRYLVELHGGTIQAKSLGQGQGATFTLTLPIRSSASMGDALHDHPCIETGELPPRFPLHGVRIVLIESIDKDNTNTLVKFANLLGQQGAQVVMTHSVQEAHAILEQFVPNLLIGDTSVLGTSHATSPQSIRALSQQFHNIPVLVLMADDGEIELLPGFAIGLQLCMANPLESTKIIETVCQLISGDRSTHSREKRAEENG